MKEQVLDSEVEEFRRAGHAAVEWVARYLERREELPVLSRVTPGEIAGRFAAAPPMEGRALESLLDDVDLKILDGMTHWNHPGFFAYFAITGSQAGIIGELLSAAFNVNGMLWRTSPAVTELELVVLDWLRQALGLPAGLFGIINDTASINTFLALAAAREQLGLDIRSAGMTGRELPPCRIYCSDQTHSSIEKAALALGFGLAGVTKIRSDGQYRLDAGHLRAVLEEDRLNGVRSCAIVATVGTTPTASVDPLPEIGALASEYGAWLHVDAAYGGSAAILPEMRWLFDGIEAADSIVVNPHKWLFTPVDCSVLYTSKPAILKETFSLVPEYLRTSEADVINYMDYGLQLGRRFRALKLWMVFEHYGVEKMRGVISGHLEMARRLAAGLEEVPDIALMAPQSLSVVVFRKLVRNGAGEVEEEASDRATGLLVEQINATGESFVSTTRLEGRLVIRVAIGHGQTEWRHLERLLEVVRQ
jgi:aromatic-L-amino-acid/L-tryptophan decarboxylase